MHVHAPAPERYKSEFRALRASRRLITFIRDFRADRSVARARVPSLILSAGRDVFRAPARLRKGLA